VKGVGEAHTWSILPNCNELYLYPSSLDIAKFPASQISPPRHIFPFPSAFLEILIRKESLFKKIPFRSPGSFPRREVKTQLKIEERGRNGLARPGPLEETFFFFLFSHFSFCHPPPLFTSPPPFVPRSFLKNLGVLRVLFHEDWWIFPSKGAGLSESP